MKNQSLQARKKVLQGLNGNKSKTLFGGILLSLKEQKAKRHEQLLIKQRERVIETRRKEREKIKFEKELMRRKVKEQALREENRRKYLISQELALKEKQKIEADKIAQSEALKKEIEEKRKLDIENRHKRAEERRQKRKESFVKLFSGIFGGFKNANDNRKNKQKFKQKHNDALSILKLSEENNKKSKHVQRTADQKVRPDNITGTTLKQNDFSDEAHSLFKIKLNQSRHKADIQGDGDAKKPVASHDDKKRETKGINKNIVVPDALKTNLIKKEDTFVFNWGYNLSVIAISAMAGFASIFGYSFFSSPDYQAVEQNIENLQSNISTIDKKIVSTRQVVGEAILFQQNIDTLNKVLDRHVYWNNLFGVLEEITVPSVSFSSFSGTIDGVYAMSGIAPNFDVIAGQLKSARENKYVLAAETSGGNVVAGGVSFGLKLTIDPNIFYKQ